MFKNQTIKKITAAVLMMVFALSITPTIVFHNWLANHKDTVTKAAALKGEQIGKQTFNCHCDHVVAESPFTDPCNTITPTVFKPLTISAAEPAVYFKSATQFRYSLRGPPTV